MFDAAADLYGDRRRLPQDLTALSAQFTTERGQRASGYMNEPRLRRAYLAWYTPLNALRVAALLERLVAEGHLSPSSLSPVADLGAGPLSASLGAALVAEGQLQVTAVDRSRGALDDGRALLEALAAHSDMGFSLDAVVLDAVDLRRRPAPLEPGRYGLIVVANVLNELSDNRRGSGLREAIVHGALRALRPGGRLLLVEPGTRIASRALMKLRDELAADDEVQILSPCPSVGRCPLGTRRGDWCHQQLAHPLPPSAQRLADEAGLAGERLLLSHLLLSVDDVDRRARRGLRLVGGVMGGQARGDRPAAAERRYACTPDGLVALKARTGGVPDEVRRPLRGAWLPSVPTGVVLEAPDRARPPKPSGGPSRGPREKVGTPKGRPSGDKRRSSGLPGMGTGQGGGRRPKKKPRR